MQTTVSITYANKYTEFDRFTFLGLARIAYEIIKIKIESDLIGKRSALAIAKNITGVRTIIFTGGGLAPRN